MDTEIKITHKIWDELVKQVNSNTQNVGYMQAEMKELDLTINSIHTQIIRNPLEVKLAVESALGEFSEENKITNLETQKLLRQQNEKIHQLEMENLKKENENKTWLIRLIAGAFVTSIVGGVLAYFLTAFLNNIAG